MSLEKQISRLADTVGVLAGVGPGIRMLFRFGAVGEDPRPIVPATPQFQSTFFAGEVLAMFLLKDTQKATASVVFKDKKGNPANVDGPPVWGVDNPNVVAIAPSADGLSCEFSAVGPLGSAIVSCKADADLGDGVTEVAGTLEVEVTAGDAAVVDISTSAPTEQ